MSGPKFVCFINAHTRKPILPGNPRPRSQNRATEADSHKTVRLRSLGKLSRRGGGGP